MPFTLKYYKKGNDEWGEPFDFTVSTEDPLAKTTFNLYSIPAGEEITITLGSTIDAHVNVYDIFGNMVLSTNASNNCIMLDVRNLHSGTYFVEVLADGQRVGIQKCIVH